MIEITFQDIHISKMGHTSGVLIGDHNTIKQFHHEQTIREAVGRLSGNENTLIDNRWLNTIESKEGQ